MTTEKTIRGDQLMLAFRFIEKSYAAFVANPLGDDLPYVVWNALKVDIEHPYGDAHWYAEIALRAPTRFVLEYRMNPLAQKEAHLILADVAASAVLTASGNELVNGLSDDDENKLIDGLTRFLGLVACGEISEATLRDP